MTDRLRGGEQSKTDKKHRLRKYITYLDSASFDETINLKYLAWYRLIYFLESFVRDAFEMCVNSLRPSDAYMRL